MEHQIKGKKADKSLIEDEILHLMEDAETARKSAADAKEAMHKAEASAKATEEAVATATAAQVARLKELDQHAAEAEKRAIPSCSRPISSCSRAAGGSCSRRS